MKFTVSLAVSFFVVALSDATTEINYGDIQNFEVIGHRRITNINNAGGQVRHIFTFPDEVILVKTFNFQKQKLISVSSFSRAQLKDS